MFAARELTVFDEEEDCSDCKVGVRRLGTQDHRNAHRRCGYKIGHAQMAGLNDFGRTDEQLPMVLLEYALTKFILNVPSESF